MKTILSTILIIISCCLSYGQVSDVVFIGVGTSKSGNNFSYKLQVTDSAGKLTGYSIADVKGPDETKSKVKGSVNYDTKQVTLRETKVIYTKYKFTNADSSKFCYINAKLKIIRKKKTTILKGKYTAYKDDRSTECDAGELVLLSAEDVLNRALKKDVNKDSIIKAVLAKEPDPVEEKKDVYVYENAVAIPDSKISKVTPGTKIELLCGTPSAKLEVWDAKTIDGDIITVKHNKKTVLDNYRLTGAYKDINLTLSKTQSDTITIIAINEGREPMNTARLKVTSGSDTYYVDASTTIDKPVMVILKRRK